VVVERRSGAVRGAMLQLTAAGWLVVDVDGRVPGLASMVWVCVTVCVAFSFLSS